MYFKKSLISNLASTSISQCSFRNFISERTISNGILLKRKISVFKKQRFFFLYFLLNQLPKFKKLMIMAIIPLKEIIIARPITPQII